MNNREIVAKKTIHEFKKFARKNNFWEEYKKKSIPLNYTIPLDYSCNYTLGFVTPTKFTNLVRYCEPVELIQSSRFFCNWDSVEPKRSHKSWQELSKEWAEICLKQKLWYNAAKSMDYVGKFISPILQKKYSFLNDNNFF